MEILKEMFKKTIQKRHEGNSEKEQKPSVPEGLWVKCPVCQKMVYKPDVLENHSVCPKCGGYFRIGARRRIRLLEALRSGEVFLRRKILFPFQNIPRNLPSCRRKPSFLRQCSLEGPPSAERKPCLGCAMPDFSWGAWAMW